MRHQRKNHHGAMTNTEFSVCAQRLAASTEKPQPALSLSDRSSSGAQRLAASTEKPPVDKMLERRKTMKCSTPCGINGKTTNIPSSTSCAYSRCSTPCGINGKTTRISDASRHNGSGCSTPCGINGKTTSVLPLADGRGSWCSTPCGINGKTTKHGRRATQLHRVLNALRHQRKNHRWFRQEPCRG